MACRSSTRETSFPSQQFLFTSLSLSGQVFPYTYLYFPQRLSSMVASSFHFNFIPPHWVCRGLRIGRGNPSIARLSDPLSAFCESDGRNSFPRLFLPQGLYAHRKIQSFLIFSPFVSQMSGFLIISLSSTCPTMAESPLVSLFQIFLMTNPLSSQGHFPGEFTDMAVITRAKLLPLSVTLSTTPPRRRSCSHQRKFSRCFSEGRKSGLIWPSFTRIASFQAVSKTPQHWSASSTHCFRAVALDAFLGSLHSSPHESTRFCRTKDAKTTFPRRGSYSPLLESAYRPTFSRSSTFIPYLYYPFCRRILLRYRHLRRRSLLVDCSPYP